MRTDLPTNCRVWSPILKKFFKPQWVSPDGLQILYLHTNDQIEIVNNPVLDWSARFRDVDGVEVFENDILELEWDEIVLMEYCHEFGCFVGMIYLEDGHEPENSVHRRVDDITCANGKIIGNLHQNKNLLLGSENP